MVPFAPQRLTANAGNRDGLFRRLVVVERAQSDGVAFEDAFDDPRGRRAGEIRTPRRACQRQGQPDDVMRGIADRRLIEIPDLDVDVPVLIGDRAEIADVAVAADPHRRPLRQRR